MPLLHMDTELVRSVGNQLQQIASATSQATQDMRHVLSMLQNSWHGSSSDYFSNDLHQVLLQVHELAESGTQLSRRTFAEVAEWERVDSSIKILATTTTYTDRSVPEESSSSLDWTKGGLKWGAIGADAYAAISSGAAALMGINILSGSTYPGQVIVKGSHAAKGAADLHSHLTHISALHMSGHVAKQMTKVGPLELFAPALRTGAQWIQDYQDFDGFNVDSAAAMVTDAIVITGLSIGGAVVGGVIGTYVGTGAGAIVGGAIGGLAGIVGGPPGMAAGAAAGASVGAAKGAVIGGVAGKIAGSYLADKYLIEPYLESELRNKVIDTTASGMREGLSLLEEATEEILIMGTSQPGPAF